MQELWLKDRNPDRFNSSNQFNLIPLLVQSNLSIKTTHGRKENWSLFTFGLDLEGQFQRLTTWIHANLRRIGILDTPEYNNIAIIPISKLLIYISFKSFSHSLLPIILLKHVQSLLLRVWSLLIGEFWISAEIKSGLWGQVVFIHKWSLFSLYSVFLVWGFWGGLWRQVVFINMWSLKQVSLC